MSQPLFFLPRPLSSVRGPAAAATDGGLTRLARHQLSTAFSFYLQTRPQDPLQLMVELAGVTLAASVSCGACGAGAVTWVLGGQLQDQIVRGGEAAAVSLLLGGVSDDDERAILATARWADALGLSDRFPRRWAQQAKRIRRPAVLTYCLTLDTSTYAILRAAAESMAQAFFDRLGDLSNPNTWRNSFSGPGLQTRH